MTPAAVIPMHTPEEALAELEYAVETLGLKVAILAGHVPRAIPGAEGARGARYIDTLGPDDPTAYDAVWSRCRELGVSPTFHSSAMGWGSRASLTNYVFNHLGNFAAGGEAACRSLFLSGVPHRFPELRFAFLEGGVAWAANLHADLIGHYEKRGGGAIARLDPARLDRAEMDALFARYADEAWKSHADRLGDSLEVLSDPAEDRRVIDEFRHTGVAQPSDIRDVFAERFFFGCEADDPMNAIAFDRSLNPFDTKLRALFSSDIGHWDVPDMRAVLIEAYEQVDEGRLEEADFRAFAFSNAVSLFGATNPRFFEGTAVEKEAADALASV